MLKEAVKGQSKLCGLWESLIRLGSPVAHLCKLGLKGCQWWCHFNLYWKSTFSGAASWVSSNGNNEVPTAAEREMAPSFYMSDSSVTAIPSAPYLPITGSHNEIQSGEINNRSDGCRYLEMCQLSGDLTLEWYWPPSIGSNTQDNPAFWEVYNLTAMYTAGFVLTHGSVRCNFIHTQQLNITQHFNS